MAAKTVYAKCDKIERLALWDDIASIYQNIRVPLKVERDSNIIMNEEEKTRDFLCILMNMKTLIFVSFL